ncbi:hypothetical protein G7939_22890 (plasmid) [Ralstonia solanacearum]|uniref:Leucine-rich repeat domain-containing protein n=3 Tax=Ralstonia TaxID=48736 RepID=A0A454TIE8_9RALS|nr:hypothetical protein CIG66_23585 [Ralstonia pseudosolanacearum]AUS45268.1 hypothetical protein CYD94_24770 [Ralstonia solanacearum]AXW17207.1 hypothetical protein CJO84_22520 [Ralstonia solanacearum]AXW41535.1 hypothetical protein CJO89_20160 [Ralstonia solanacearum]MCK4119938.1 hypothetical protein [Ralstonia pseudosolanacearum]
MRDKARQMPTVANPLAVASLRIWYCSYKTLESITVFRNLRTLVIADFPDASLGPLGTLPNLRHLRILHLPKIVDLGALAGLANLETLSLEVLPSWDASCKKTIVNSLEPIAQIAHLKHLSLLGVVPVDRSLASLERCGSLISAQLHGYPRKEADRFFAASGVLRAHPPSLQFD